MKKDKLNNLKKKTRKENIIKIISVLILIAVIALSLLYITQLNTSKTEEFSFYQYLGGEKHVYQGALKITKKKDITELVCKDIEITLDSTPVYYNEEPNKALFPEDMAIVYPLNNGKMSKITRFATCTSENLSVFIEMGEQKSIIGTAFLFDGNDLYFFLEKTDIKIGEDVYTVSALSYATVLYDQYIEIYNKEADKCDIFEIEGKEVLATTEDYVINMNVDTLECNGKEQLLLKKIESLTKLEE